MHKTWIPSSILKYTESIWLEQDGLWKICKQWIEVAYAVMYVSACEL